MERIWALWIIHLDEDPSPETDQDKKIVIIAIEIFRTARQISNRLKHANCTTLLNGNENFRKRYRNTKPNEMLKT